MNQTFSINKGSLHSLLIKLGLCGGVEKLICTYGWAGGPKMYGLQQGVELKFDFFVYVILLWMVSNFAMRLFSFYFFVCIVNYVIIFNISTFHPSYLRHEFF